jgi:hypothetical protein
MSRSNRVGYLAIRPKGPLPRTICDKCAEAEVDIEDLVAPLVSDPGGDIEICDICGRTIPKCVLTTDSLVEFMIEQEVLLLRKKRKEVN